MARGQHGGTARVLCGAGTALLLQRRLLRNDGVRQRTDLPVPPARQHRDGDRRAELRAYGGMLRRLVLLGGGMLIHVSVERAPEPRPPRALRCAYGTRIAVVVASCSGPSSPLTDGGSVDARRDTGSLPVCGRHGDCDNGRYCDGEERCSPGEIDADER